MVAFFCFFCFFCFFLSLVCISFYGLFVRSTFDTSTGRTVVACLCGTLPRCSSCLSRTGFAQVGFGFVLHTPRHLVSLVTFGTNCLTIYVSLSSLFALRCVVLCCVVLCCDVHAASAICMAGSTVLYTKRGVPATILKVSETFTDPKQGMHVNHRHSLSVCMCPWATNNKILTKHQTLFCFVFSAQSSVCELELTALPLLSCLLVCALVSCNRFTLKTRQAHITPFKSRPSHQEALRLKSKLWKGTLLYSILCLLLLGDSYSCECFVVCHCCCFKNTCRWLLRW